MWYHKVIGAERCPIVDTWWQTETGAIMMTPIPGVTPTKPGSCAKPLPGIFADIVDDEGRPVKTPDAGGYLVIKRPWPSMLRTIWGDNERYLKTYWEKFQRSLLCCRAIRRAATRTAITGSWAASTTY